MQTGQQPVISDEVRARFAGATSVLVLTGAGVSAESGVPTFRGGGQTAVWKGLPFDVISSGVMLERDLPAVWQWFNYRRGALRGLKPNAAHHAIARWQEKFERFTLATQNVDGLHELAGSHDVLELHGSVWRARCLACEGRQDLRQTNSDDAVPSCCECGSSMRPDVVLFGEMLPPTAFERASMRAETCDLCLVVGTSGVVYPAASLPEIARAAGAYVVEINPERTPLSSICDETLMGKAGDLLPLIG